MEPKIRIKGFSEDWKKVYIGACGTWSKGKSLSKEDIIQDGINKCIHYGELFTLYNEVIHTVCSRTNIVKGRFSQIGDILFPDSDVTPTGLAKCSSIMEDNVILGGGINILKPVKDKYSPFLSYSINREKKQIISRVTGTTVRHINAKGLSEVQISIPKGIEEQKAIAKFLELIDSQISVSTSRLASLKQIKVASLQAMFPQDGETMPKVRFKEFKGEWKRVKLNEIAMFSRGQGYLKSDLIDQGHPIILYGRMYTNFEFAICKVDTHATKRENSILSEGNEVIMPASGETPEDIARASAVLIKQVILGGDLNIMRFDLRNYCTPFIALAITYGKTHAELSKYSQGKSVVHLHNREIRKASIMIPSYKEQQAIADFFTNLDHQISLHAKRLEKLKHIKAACLEKMFV